MALFMWLVVGAGFWMGPQIFTGEFPHVSSDFLIAAQLVSEKKSLKRQKAEMPVFVGLCLAIFYRILLAAGTGPA